MVVLSEAFSVANRAAEDPKCSKRPMPLTRRLSQELVLASVLSVVACADLTAPLADRVFATDASLARGAACSCPVPPAVCRSLWQNGDRRGAYTRLEEGPRILLKAAGLAPEAEDIFDQPVPPAAPGAVPFLLDVLEIGCCEGFLRGPGIREGLDLGPLICPAASRHYDVLSPSFASWLHDMLQGGFVRSLLIAPPCGLCGTQPGPVLWKRCLGCPVLLGPRPFFHCLALLAWPLVPLLNGMRERVCAQLCGSPLSFSAPSRAAASVYAPSSTSGA